MINNVKKGLRIRLLSLLAVAIFIPISGFTIIESQAITDGQTVESGGYSYDVNFDVWAYDRISEYQNRIIEEPYYLGPNDVMLETTNGTYLGFVRFALSHVGGAGDMELYRSIDNAYTWTSAGTLHSVGNRDTRNYVCGVSQTGRVFVFYTLYDFTNNTWSNDIEYRYSDNNGTTWGSHYNITMTTMGGFTPLACSPSWSMRTYGSNRIGFFIYADNQTDFALNLTQTRFVYSDNDGATWTQVVVGANTPDPNVRTEMDSIYLGNNEIVALARMEAGMGPEEFRSHDNGLTWTDDGPISNSLGPGQLPFMSLLEDDQGDEWVLTFIGQGTAIHYAIAKASDLILQGVSSWSAVRDAPTISGGFPITIVHPGPVNDGFIMTEIEESGSKEFVLIWNMTATLNKSRYLATVSPLVPIIFVFLAIGMVVTVISQMVIPVTRDYARMKVDEIIRNIIGSVIFIVIGLVMLRIAFSFG